MPTYNWSHFVPGAVLEDVAIEIVTVLAAHHTQSQTLYDIRYTCCGRRAWLSHERIKERQRTAASGKLAMPGLCRECNYKKKRDDTEGLFKPQPQKKPNHLPDWYTSPASAWPAVRNL